MRKTLLSVVLASSLLSAPVFAEVDKLMQEANACARSKDLTGALEKVNQVINEDPKQARAYALRAHIHFANENYGDALCDFTQAIALDPTNTRYLVERGLCHYTLKHDQLAIADLEKALELNPNSAFAKAMYKKIGSEKFDENVASNEPAVKIKNGVVNLKQGAVRIKNKAK